MSQEERKVGPQGEEQQMPPKGEALSAIPLPAANGSDRVEAAPDVAVSMTDVQSEIAGQAFEADMQEMARLPHIGKFFAPIRPEHTATAFGDASVRAWAKEIYFPQLDAELAADTDLAADVEAIFLHGDREALAKKSKKQLEELRRAYFGKTFSRDILERPKKEKKLQAFTAFTHSLRPVRGDANGAITEFKSPRETGVASHFGANDILVQADAYVYGSFDRVAHMMAQGSDQRVLDEEDIRPRAEIVMQDISNLGHAQGEMAQRYVTNVFDYDTGKDILATYLASVFESPEEAEAFLRENSNSEVAQGWERRIDGFEYSPGMQVAPARLEAIQAKMKVLLETTGLEPPLSLEIRVRESAKVKV